MARIAIVNPPHRRRRKKHAKVAHVRHFRRKNAPKRKRRMSPKARAAAIRNLKKARAKLNHKSKPVKTRSGLKRRKHKRVSRRRRSRPTRGFKNPFGGELLVMSNPRRKRKSKSKRRKNPMARRHRRSSRRRYSNPLSAKALLSQPKELISKDFAMDAVAVTGGFVLPGIVMNYVPTTFRDQPWKFYASKVVVVSLLATAGTMLKPKLGRMVLLGGGVSLLMDIFQSFMAAKAPAAPAAAANAYYGPGIHAYYGDLDTSGDSLDGSTGDLVEDSGGEAF